jgi:hypothetical protein
MNKKKPTVTNGRRAINTIIDELNAKLRSCIGPHFEQYDQVSTSIHTLVDDIDVRCRLYEILEDTPNIRSRVAILAAIQIIERIK